MREFPLRMGRLNAMAVIGRYSAPSVLAAVRAAHPTLQTHVLLVESRFAARDFSGGVSVLPAAESPEEQVRLATEVIEKEAAGDRFLMIDSLTDLAFLYNRIPIGGRSLVSGLDPRRVEPLRSLLSGPFTVLGLLRRENGSRMTEVTAELFIDLAGGR